MPVPVHNVEIYQGQTTRVPLQFVDATGACLPIGDYDGWAVEVRAAPGGVLFGLGEIVVDDADSGQLTVVIPASVSAAATGSSAAYDVFAVAPSGDMVKFVEGPSCTVIPRVTVTVPPAEGA
jgi:hypothetical protein